jgi:hypothetical protein
VAAATDQIAYTKVGRLVHVIGYLNVDSESSPSGHLRVSLPFAVADLGDYANSGYTRGLTVSSHADGTADTNVLGWFDSSDGAVCPFYQLTNATGVIDSFREDEVDGAWSISINVSYYA